MGNCDSCSIQAHNYGHSEKGFANGMKRREKNTKIHALLAFCLAKWFFARALQNPFTI